MTIILPATPLTVDNPNFVDDPIYWEEEEEETSDRQRSRRAR